MRKPPNTVYIGYDPREDVAYEVLKFTIERIAVDNVRVVPIRKDLVERMGIYTRKYDVVDGQSIDRIDGKPFSSDFSFTRFLVPALNMYEGWALYMDCDMFTSPLVVLGLKIGSAREPQTVNMQQSGTETIPTLLVKER